jgi:hypothetical protein
MNALPPELINYILGFLDNNDFYNCLLAGKIMHVHTPGEIYRRKKMKYDEIPVGELIARGDLIGLRFKPDVKLRENFAWCCDGDLKVFKMMLFEIDKTGMLLSTESDHATAAIRSGNLEMLKLLFFMKYRGIYREYLVLYYGNVELVRWFGVIFGFTHVVLDHFIGLEQEKGWRCDYKLLGLMKTFISSPSGLPQSGFADLAGRRRGRQRS